MNSLDQMLESLGDAPMPPRLMAIDNAVFAELAARQSGAASLPRGMVGLAVVAALGMGLAGAVVPGTRADASPGLTPFGAPAALAPSTLLDSGE